MSIPKITKETISSVTVSMEHDDEFFNKFLTKVKKENNLIYQLIEIVRSIGTGRDDDAAQNYLRGVCTVYKLIESQLESEEMNKIWGEKDG